MARSSPSPTEAASAAQAAGHQTGGALRHSQGSATLSSGGSARPTTRSGSKQQHAGGSEIQRASPSPLWPLEEAGQAVMNVFDSLLAPMGLAPLGRTIPEGQPLRARALGQLLAVANDPGAQFIANVDDIGCDLGVTEALPRAPLVYREKACWRLGE